MRNIKRQGQVKGKFIHRFWQLSPATASRPYIYVYIGDFDELNFTALGRGLLKQLPFSQNDQTLI